MEVTNSAKGNQKFSDVRSKIYPLDFFDMKVLNALGRISSWDMEEGAN